MSFREKVAFYLEDIETPLGRFISLVITGFVLVSSAIFVAETYSLSAAVRSALEAIESVILAIFVCEYCLRFWCAENKLRFILRISSIIDLMAILPFLLGNPNVGFLRIFRWIRILRLIRFLSGRTLFGYVSSEDAAIFARILFTIFSIIFVYAGLIYQVEHPVNSQQFSTFLDSIYFCVVTITTAGFGDITPITQMGRLLTILMGITGLIFIPWQLGDLIRRLVKTSNQIQLTCSQCGWAVHDTDAKHCKMCGAPLSQPDRDPPVPPAIPEAASPPEIVSSVSSQRAE